MTVWLLSSCALIAALVLLRRVLRNRLDPRVTYALWLLAVGLAFSGAAEAAPDSEAPSTGSEVRADAGPAFSSELEQAAVTYAELGVLCGSPTAP